MNFHAYRVSQSGSSVQSQPHVWQLPSRLVQMAAASGGLFDVTMSAPAVDDEDAVGQAAVSPREADCVNFEWVLEFRL